MYIEDVTPGEDWSYHVVFTAECTITFVFVFNLDE